jgi:hypothetical protein
MTTNQLEGKFRGMCDQVLGAERCGALMAACWSLGGQTDLRALTALTRR